MSSKVERDTQARKVEGKKSVLQQVKQEVRDQENDVLVPKVNPLFFFSTGDCIKFNNISLSTCNFYNLLHH